MINFKIRSIFKCLINKKTATEVTKAERNTMKIKAKYNFLNTTRYKYFHDLDEMDKFFRENKVCKYISHEEGNAVEAEAKSRGFY